MFDYYFKPQSKKYKYYEHPMRKLARSFKFRQLSEFFKDNNLDFFKNKEDFTNYQFIFLNWMKIIDSIQENINIEKPFAHKDLLKEPMLLDAYLTLLRKRPDLFKDKIEKNEYDDNKIFERNKRGNK